MSVDEIPEPSADGPRDPHLPVLSVEQADALRRLAELTFTAHGVPVQSDGRDTVRHGSQVYGLMNLSRSVAQEPWSEWPARLARHAAAMVAANTMEAEPPAVSRDQWLLKLAVHAELPFEPDFDVNSGLPGLDALPAIDHPSHVAHMLGADELRKYAEPHEFREQALANLRSLPPPDVIPVAPDESDPDSTVFALGSEDFYGAARVLVLDHLIETLPEVPASPHGYIVGVPSRHLLVVHPVTGPGVFAAIPMMVNLAEQSHAERPGPITDDLYFIPTDAFELAFFPHEEIAQRITLRTEDKVMIMVPGHLEHALEQLGLVGGSEE